MPFGEPTDSMMHKALDKDYMGQTLFGYEKILLALLDGHWHPARDLNNAAGWRFGDSVFTLREKGVVLPSEPSHDGTKGDWYRLASTAPQGVLFG